ncbi:MAG: 50S ribosomal protein L21 [Cyanobacteria bacterium P01_E01_bin.42]
MTYAIVETGGKQLRVEPGRFYDIELLHVDPDESYSIDKVLLVHHDDDIHIGQPFVEGATVEGTIMRHFRGRKVIVYKMRPKKKTRKKRGHRQEITRLMINSIQLNGSVLAEADVSALEAETPNLAPDPAPIVEADEPIAAAEPEASVTEDSEAAAPETAETVKEEG